MNSAQRMMRASIAAAGFGYSALWNSTHNNFLFVLSNTRRALSAGDLATRVVHLFGNTTQSNKKLAAFRPRLLIIAAGIAVSS